MYKNIIFITGIGTGVGKTYVSSILVNKLKADYWKPIQAGLLETDKEIINKNLNNKSITYNEVYKLQNATSPHWAANKENVIIKLTEIKKKYFEILNSNSINNTLIIEGVGGLLSPINNSQQNIHLIKTLNLPVIIISRNYLGSINHSLMTANILKQHKCKILGWIFNDTYLDYENDIVKWSKIPKLLSIKNLENKNLNLTKLKTLLK